MTDITLTSGTTRKLAITVNDDSEEAIDLTLLTDMAWVVLDGARGIIQKTLLGGEIGVTSATDGEILVSIAADDTSPTFGVGSTTDVKTYTHEARLWFSDDTPPTQEVVTTGSLTINPTGTWKGNVAWTSGADRVVYVQGRY